MKTVSYVQSVDRAMTILRILQENSEGLGVTELSHRLGVSKSTTHRLLMSLQKHFMVQQDPLTEKYRLGLKLLELGNAVADTMDIRKIAHPHLKKLTEVTGETTHLVLLDGFEVVYIDKIESNATIGMKSRIGKRAPTYCTGVGKALLSYLSKDRVIEIMENSEIKQFTKTTITNLDDLFVELKKIKEQGYSLDLEEHEEGIRCVGAPILDHNNKAVAGISVAGPLMRMNQEKMDFCIKSILECASDISKNLGHHI